MIRIALVEPEIPPNTGSVARLCAATRVPLHIVGATGFRLDDRAVRRAGLDYWPEVTLHRHPDLDSLYGLLPEARFLYLTTKAEKPYTEWPFSDHDCLIFGRETGGLNKGVLRGNWDRCHYSHVKCEGSQSEPGNVGGDSSLRSLETNRCLQKNLKLAIQRKPT